MKQLIRVFGAGLIVSFLGSLPLGTLNVAAMQIAITESIMSAVMFSLGSLTAEMVYVRLSLFAMDWVRRQEKVFKLLEWLTLLVVLSLAIASFYAALQPSVQDNVILNNRNSYYLLGLIMSAVNPVQIPFWFGWSTVLFTKGILHPKPSNYNFYIFGIGLGTLLGNFVFIFGGRLAAKSLQNNQSLLNYIIGTVFAITALIQACRMFARKKKFKEKVQDEKENTSEKMD